MKKIPHIALTALVAGALAPAAALAAKPSAGAPTITPSAKRIVFGKSVTIAGQVPAPNNVAGVTVTLQADPFPFGKFDNVTTALTNATGRYSFTSAPVANTKFRVNAKTKPAANSAEVLVGVRRRVTRAVSDATPAAGQKVRFAGSVFPAKDGATIQLQRHSKTGWKTVTTTVLKDAGTDHSRYSRSITVRRDGRFRIVIPGDGTFLAGISTSVVLNAH
jgi:hypothetical protein